MPADLTTDLSALAPILAVTATALALMVVDWFVSGDDPRLPAGLSLVGLAGAGLLATRGWADPERLAFVRQVALPGAEAVEAGLLRIDRLGAFIGLVLLVTAALVVLASVEYVRRRGLARVEYWVLLLLATAGMMLLAVANDLIVLFLALETFSVALYVLAGFVRGERASQEAALKYFVLGAFGAGFLLYGVALLYAATGTTNLDLMGEALAATGGPPAVAWLGFGMLLAGLGFKAAIVPFHQWTPDVYEGAPTTVTAFMAAGTKAAAVAALVRVLWTAFPALADTWVPLVGGLAVLTMLVGNLAALVQADLKRMLAYSAIAHAGYILVAVAVGPYTGTAAALFYVLAYALMNLCAFNVLTALGPVGDAGRDATSLDDLAGLGRRHPGLALALSVCLVSLTGLPPTIGFLAKWYVFRAAVDADLTVLAVAIVLNSVLSAFYYLRPIVYMYAGKPTETAEIEVSTPDAVAVAVTAMVVALGLLVAKPMIDSATRASAVGPTSGSAPTLGGPPEEVIMFTAPEYDPANR